MAVPIAPPMSDEEKQYYEKGSTASTGIDPAYPSGFEEPVQVNKLNRQLKNRHIAMIRLALIFQILVQCPLLTACTFAL